MPRDSSEGYTDERGKREAIKTQAGYFLDEDLGCIDTSFFSMGRKEVERCDPRQRQLLEVAREAFNSATEAEFCGKSIGCCVGTFSEDCLQLLLVAMVKGIGRNFGKLCAHHHQGPHRRAQE
ncbi:hypothetical protein ACKVWE_008191 [Pyricularia oryzae]